jgi:aminoglycoside phosphotransferase family enzyme/predicted kinase
MRCLKREASEESPETVTSQLDHRDRTAAPGLLYVSSDKEASSLFRRASAMNVCAEQLIVSLQRPEVWPDTPSNVRVIETHISWVLLMSEFAWKIKKPVKFDFLDFSTLERRKYFCEEELRLNRRTAPELYLDVVPICGDATAPVIGGDGEPIEYAVKMRRFEDERLLSRMVNEGRFKASQIDALAEHIATFHASLPGISEELPYGRADRIRHDAIDNFRTIERLAVGDEAQTAEVRHLHPWTQTAAERLADTFEQRRAGGFVRECHGDLHLGNIVELDSGPCLFDCIEFNAGFRWSDVISEIAFLVMDLEEHGEPKLARRLLNRYLERTGDYAGLAVLRFYLVYRAMVRAKVDAIRLGDSPQLASQRRLLRREFGTYLAVADHDSEVSPPSLIIMHGLSGSGKSHVAGQIVENSAAIRIRSDVERKRLFGLDETERVEGAAAAELYSPAASERTYGRLAELARTIIESGFPAVVDAAFLARDEREQFRRLAGDLQVPFLIVACSAPESALLERVIAREQAGRDASDAGASVLRQQLQRDTQIGDEPPDEIVRVDTATEASTAAGLRRVLDRLV